MAPAILSVCRGLKVTSDDGRPSMEVTQGQSEERRASIGRALLHKRRTIEKLLGAKICTNPHWDMLLELYLAELAKRHVYQSSLATDAPPANTHRRSAKLEAMGMTFRSIDPSDNRRLIVKLRPDVRSVFDQIMDQVGEIFSTI